MTDQPSPQVPATISDGIRDRQVLAAISLTDRGAGKVMLPQNFNEVVVFSEMMARADLAVPKHLRNNPGACMAVIMRATGWEMDAFAVASKTYSVNDQIGYEAQVIAAVVHARAPIKGLPTYEYFGEGLELQCRVTVELTNGDTRDYVSPKLKDISPRNSPLWKTDPPQQIGYYSIRALARRYFPGVILGVYDPEELRAMQEVPEDRPAKSFDALEARAGVTLEDGQHTSPGDRVVVTAPSEGSDKPSVEVVRDPGEDYAEGHATPGESYFIAGDPFTETGRRPLYKDGQKVSTVGPKEGIKVYRQHPPIAAAAAVGSQDGQADAASPVSDGGTATAAGTPGSGAATATQPATSTVKTSVKNDGKLSVKVSFAEEGALPDPGEIYMLGQVIYHGDGTWTGNVARGVGDVLQFWRNGGQVELTPAEAPKSLWAYVIHPPRPTQTASAQTAGAGQATSDSATPASTYSQGQKGSSQTESSKPSADSPDDETHFPHAHPDQIDLEEAIAQTPDDRIKPAGEPQDADFEELAIQDQEETESPPTARPEPALATFAAAVAAATDWPHIYLALRGLYNDPVWSTWGPEQKNRPRFIAFVRLKELNAAGYKFDFITDLQAYRCYIIFETDPAALEFNHKTIQRDPKYLAMRSDDRAMLEKAVQDRLADLIAGASGEAPEERMD